MKKAKAAAMHSWADLKLLKRDAMDWPGFWCFVVGFVVMALVGLIPPVHLYEEIRGALTLKGSIALISFLIMSLAAYPLRLAASENVTVKRGGWIFDGALAALTLGALLAQAKYPDPEDSVWWPVGLTCLFYLSIFSFLALWWQKAAPTEIAEKVVESPCHHPV